MQANTEHVRDERVVIEITRDKMMGIIWFDEPVGEGKTLTDEMIRKEITERGIVFGIDDKQLEEIIKTRRCNYKYIIAKGEPALKGEDAYLTFKFDKEALKHFKPEERANGTVDLKNLNIVTNVKVGDILVVKTPCIPGMDGTNVMGQTVKPPKIQDMRLPQGKNTRILEDGVTLAASIDGKLCYDDHNVYLSPVFTVAEDVDSSTGNIKFVGDVVVNGNVKNGFTVEAGGSIHIQGSVEGAELRAGKDIIIAYGIQGMDKGHIKTKGNLFAKFIQNAHVEAAGNIKAEAIMHSYVGATTIDVTKGKGLIVGGHIVAANQIYANTIGSNMATHTDIQIGVSAEFLSDHKELEKEYNRAKEDMQKISQSVAFLIAKRDGMTADKQALLSKLMTTKVEVEKNYKQLTTEYRASVEKIRDVQSGHIKVSNKVHSGVKVMIGTAVKYISEDYNYCTIEKRGADIAITPY